MPGPRTRTLQPPIEGLNARDSLSAMKPTFGLKLDNWVCRSDGLHVRAGFGVDCSGLGASPNALAMWRSGPQVTGGPVRGPTTLFAATATGLYNVSASAIASLAWAFGAMAGPISSCTQSTEAGTFLCVVNGVDGLRVFNGTSWLTANIIGGGTGLQTTPNPSLWRDVFVHHSRIFAVEAKSLRLWYLRPRTIQGIANPINITPLCRNGGTIVAAASLQTGGARGPQDMLVIVTSGGEMVVYSGTNIDTDLALQGVYDIPVPAPRNALVQHGGKLMLISQEGVLPVMDIIADAKDEKELSATTDVIKNLWAAGWVGAQSAMGDFSGLDSGAARMDITHVPGAGTWIRTPETKGWTIWPDLNATCWLDDGTDLFFGRPDGTVCSYGGQTDNGKPINALMVGAFSSLGTSGTKRFSRARLLMDRADYYVPKFQLLTNYEAVPSGIVGDNIASQYWQWPQITWADQPTPWVKGRSQSRDLWRGVSGRGHVMAPILAVQAASPLVYSGVEVMYSTGVL